MPEHPILFSSSMTRAILSGTKSQTRRVVRVPAGYEIAGSGQAAGHVPGGAPVILCTRATGAPGDRVVHCPYGEPGHRLWVRETFAPRYFEDGGRPGYRADWDGTAANVAPEPRWKPAIHMSRREARLELEVTDVRVERLQDIREEDALAEGVEAAPCCEAGRSNVLPVEAFRCIWNRINGKREGCAWSANPWVWCVSFRLTVPSTDPHRDEARVADRSAP
jgi:hypothetical protein